MANAKWADHIITGVWFESGTKDIEYVNLHADNGDTMGKGQKTHKDIVIKRIEAKQTVATAKWNYARATWEKGVAVHVVTERSGKKHLRSNHDQSVSDNLDNLIDMGWLA